MKRIFAGLSILSLSLFFANCKSDDNANTGGTVVPLRDRTEVYTENTDSIAKYLKNNYIYENPTTGEIKFDSITNGIYDGEPTLDKDTRLKSVTFKNDLYAIKSIATKTIDPMTGMWKDAVTRLEYTPVEDDVKEYTIHYFIINEGTGKKAMPIDSVYVKSKVHNLDNEVVTNPYKPEYYSFPLTIHEFNGRNLVTGKTVARPAQLTSGERQVLSLIKTAEGVSIGADGSIQTQGTPGRLIAIIPSGLYTFNNPVGTKLKGYQPAIVDITLYNSLDRDHDLDGIPSKYEVDPSKIGTELTMEDYFGYSTSGFEKTPNFLNIDDDDDGVPTYLELQYKENGIVKYYQYDDERLKICTDTPNYLDKTCRPYMEDGEWVWKNKKP
ncbi:hypothetical protein [Myroides pelagicus]|uniref:FKBP-type peptidylprolyl isomerase n=1 Tax=Myroides pelagicus TaxID=270914 RepID=A0A7K1GP62_9FLAO|nr:hypothetical protein [Myroides pelagicus]MEC4114569.1 hypothetical protein [Myroides pelagicus]MTH30193.1 hypothetical protein [Myroides pelagicus]